MAGKTEGIYLVVSGRSASTIASIAGTPEQHPVHDGGSVDHRTAAGITPKNGTCRRIKCVHVSEFVEGPRVEHAVCHAHR